MNAVFIKQLDGLHGPVKGTVWLRKSSWMAALAPSRLRETILMPESLIFPQVSSVDQGAVGGQAHPQPKLSVP